MGVNSPSILTSGQVSLRHDLIKGKLLLTSLRCCEASCIVGYVPQISWQTQLLDSLLILFTCLSLTHQSSTMTPWIGFQTQSTSPHWMLVSVSVIFPHRRRSHITTWWEKRVCCRDRMYNQCYFEIPGSWQKIIYIPVLVRIKLASYIP